MHDFGSNNERGKVAERQVLLQLEHDGYQVEDVSDVEDYQNIGIDFIATRGNQRFTLDVKSDNKIESNICLELETDGKIGWWLYSKANFIFIVPRLDDYALKGNYFILSRESAKEYLGKNHNNRSLYRTSDMGRQGRGLLVNIEKLKQAQLLREQRWTI